MENKSNQLTSSQGNRIFFMETFCAAALFLPQMILKESYEEGLLVVILGCLLLGGYTYLVAYISKGIPMEQVLGRYKFISIIYYVRFMINASFFYSYILYLVNRYLLPGKHPIFVGIPFLILAFYMNQGKLAGRGRVLEGVFWFVLIPLIVIFVLAVGDLSFDQLKVTDVSILNLGRGILLFMGLLHPTELLWFYRGNMKESGIRLPYYLGLCGTLVGTFVIVVGSLGKRFTLIDHNPVMSMAQGVEVPGGVMARLDIFLIAFFVVGLFLVVCGYLFYGNESLRQAFPKWHRWGKVVSYGGLILLAGVVLDLHKICMKYFHLFVYGNLVVGVCLPMIIFYCWKKGLRNEE